MTELQVQRHLEGVALRRQYERSARMDLAWHIQAIAPERQRHASMPNYAKFVSCEKQSAEPRRQTPEQMRDAMIGIVNAFGGRVEKLTGPQPEHRRLPD